MDLVGFVEREVRRLVVEEQDGGHHLKVRCPKRPVIL